jgi:membrane-associated protease RseP (regulator of RpoE activity)
VNDADEPDEPEEVIEQGWAGLVGLVGLVVALGVLAGISWVIVVLALIFMIFMHELGHFLTAKWSGMKVTEFFIGFGPRIWSFRRGETEYGVKAIPAGAYVRISGMNSLDEVPEADEARAYRAKSYPRRMAVALAGSTMHFLMALVLLFVLFAVYGEPLDRQEAAADNDNWTLSSISVDSAAEAAGLQIGDRLISVDGVDVSTFDEFGDLVEVRGGTEVEIVYERDGVSATASAVIGERLTEAGAAGIDPLIAFDRILAVDGRPVASYAEFSDLVTDRIGEPIRLTFVDAASGEPGVFDRAVVEKLIAPAEATTGFFGVSADFDRESLGLGTSAVRSVTEFGDFTWESMSALGRFFTPGSIGDFVSGAFDSGDDEATVAVSAREVEARRLDASNPDENRIISIYGAARIGASATDQSLEGLFEFLVLINIFVGVFNLVPLLPLDGGHVMVATYERIRSIGGTRYQADAAKLLPLTYAVFVVLVTLGLFALVRDIIDPIDL